MKHLFKFKKMAVVLVMFFFLFTTVGCTGTVIRAIEHREMNVTARMSDTIFLDVETLYKNRSIFVRVTNTSDFQEIDFDYLIEDILAKRGFVIAKSPLEAGYVLQANLLYLGQAADHLTAEGMLAGGFGGALIGDALGGGRSLGGALAGGLVGGIAGGLVGAAFKVDTYMGAIDIQIEEPVAGGVKKAVKAEIAKGIGGHAIVEHERIIKRQQFRTRIVVKATQTNIDREKATNAIAGRIAAQIAGIF